MAHTPAEQLIDASTRGYWNKMEDLRVQQAQKMFYWYYNDRDEIILHVTKALQKTFRPETVKRMNVRVYNIVEKVVDKLAKVYKKPAERVLDGGVQMVEIGGENGQEQELEEQQSDSDKRYQELLLKTDINSKAKEWHKLGKFFNTVLVQPMWIEDKESTPPQFEPHFQFLVHTPAWAVVEVSSADFLRPIAFYYPVWAEINGKSQQALVYWSIEEHYLVDRLGVRHPVGDNADMKNPYKRLPIAVLRFKSGMDFWGDGMWDLVDGNEEASVQFANLAFTGLFQAHGQPVAINMGIKGSPQIGPDQPIVTDDAGMGGKQQSSFTFASPNADITGVTNMIDWMVKMLQATKGLSPNDFVVESRISSGIAKMMDSAGVQEMREDEQQVLEDFEFDLFDVTRTIQNVEDPGNKLADDAEFSVKFAETAVIKTTEEKIKERESGVKLGHMSRVDIIMEDNPGMSREDAAKTLQRIIREEQQFKDEFGLLTKEFEPGKNGEGVFE